MFTIVVEKDVHIMNFVQY